MQSHPIKQIIAYITNVHTGVKNSIIGRKDNPTTKLAPQFVLVLKLDPIERTLNGNSSLCIHGTFPIPIAYEPVYTIMLARTSRGAVRSDNGTDSYADADEEGFSELKSAGSVINTNPTLHNRRPMVMIGIDRRRMRLLPTRSISTRAAQVMKKFVMATVREVNVGLSKPTMVNMVAEKYIREFWCFISDNASK